MSPDGYEITFLHALATRLPSKPIACTEVLYRPKPLVRAPCNYIFKQEATVYVNFFTACLNSLTYICIYKDYNSLFTYLNCARCSSQLQDAISMFHPVDYPGWRTNIISGYIDHCFEYGELFRKIYTSMILQVQFIVFRTLVMVEKCITTFSIYS